MLTSATGWAHVVSVRSFERTTGLDGCGAGAGAGSGVGGDGVCGVGVALVDGAGLGAGCSVPEDASASGANAMAWASAIMPPASARCRLAALMAPLDAPVPGASARELGPRRAAAEDQHAERLRLGLAAGRVDH